jgi:hypothetical protein
MTANQVAMVLNQFQSGQRIRRFAHVRFKSLCKLGSSKARSKEKYEKDERSTDHSSNDQGSKD